MAMSVPRFWREAASRYNLIGAVCKCCKKVYFPPRRICVECHRASIGKMEKIKLSGEGKVISYTTIHNPQKGFEQQVPYNIAIIELNEGVRITAQIIECKREDIKIGMKVRAVFRKLSEEGKRGIIHYGYKFVPV